VSAALALMLRARHKHVSCASWRACCAGLPDKHDTSRHNFFLCQNAWARQRVVTWQIEFGLITTKTAYKSYQHRLFQ